MIPKFFPAYGGEPPHWYMSAIGFTSTKTTGTVVFDSKEEVEAAIKKLELMDQQIMEIRELLRSRSNNNWISKIRLEGIVNPRHGMEEPVS